MNNEDLIHEDLLEYESDIDIDLTIKEISDETLDIKESTCQVEEDNNISESFIDDKEETMALTEEEEEEKEEEKDDGVEDRENEESAVKEETMTLTEEEEKDEGTEDIFPEEPITGENDTFSAGNNSLFGFIVTRHVNSETTNKYWNQNVKLIRSFYPFSKIIIIDDNSNYDFVKADVEYKNVEFIQSEYPGKGELLPYIYYARHKWFERAVIIHDSVFIHKRIPFGKINYPVLPIWHFKSDKLHYNEAIHIANNLNHSDVLIRNLSIGKMWNGCFGVMSVIKHNFLMHIMNKYNLNNLLNMVFTSRDYRCALERIFGLIFSLECRTLYPTGSLLGSIFTYSSGNGYRFGYTFDEYYQKFIRERKVIKTMVKVWTGR